MEGTLVGIFFVIFMLVVMFIVEVIRQSGGIKSPKITGNIGKILLLIGILLAFICSFAMESGGAAVVVMLIGVAIMMVGFIMLKAANEVNSDTQKACFDDLVKNYYWNNTLELNEKNIDNAKRFIQIKQLSTMSVAHEPKTIHVGAVTVGGITTGGTYETGGYNYISGYNKTDFFSLDLELKKETSHSISKIRLSPEYLEKAQNNDKIAKFIKDDTIIVREDPNFTETEKAEALATARMLADNRTGTTSKLMYKGCPNYEKATDILNWINSL